MRSILRHFILIIFVLSNGTQSSAFAGAISCNLVPLDGTGALSDPVARPAWRIKPELPTVRDFRSFPAVASPQLYQFDCSDNPKGKPQSGISPKIPILQLD